MVGIVFIRFFYVVVWVFELGGYCFNVFGWSVFLCFWYWNSGWFDSR